MNPANGPAVSLSIRPEIVAVARLDPGEGWPVWALTAPFSILARTESERSVVCPASLVPDGVRAEGPWRAIQSDGPLDFGIVGLLAGLTSALAAAGIAVFAVSTFDTDILLVRADALAAAVGALRAAGYPVRAEK